MFFDNGVLTMDSRWLYLLAVNGSAPRILHQSPVVRNITYRHTPTLAAALLRLGNHASKYRSQRDPPHRGRCPLQSTVEF